MELYTSFKEATRQFESKVALQFDKMEQTFKQVYDCSNIVGHALLERYPNRQHIGILTPNTPHFFYGLFGILGAGHVSVPLNPLLNPEELSILIDHSDCDVLLYDPYLQEKAEQAVARLDRDIVLLSIPELVANESPNAAPLSPNVDDSEPSMILYTSGTTGNPKGVVLTHNNVYSNYQSFSELLQFKQADTFLCSLPLYHTYAMTVIVFSSLLTGARIILFSQFSPQLILEAVMKEPNVVWPAVPPMLYMVARFAPDDAAEKHHFRYAVSGGGPLPVDVWHLFKKKFNHEILEGYGLTETSPVVSYNPPGKMKVGTIGPPLPGVEVEIRDESGNVLGSSQIGELCVRGDLTMKEYYKNPEATQEAFYENGWLRTGDMASIDEDGYIKIVGRLKDLIVSGGENIYPREIEETLMRCPGVKEAAVVAKPNKLRSEVPHAYITLSDESKDSITESSLRKFCREHLAEYKVPEGFTFLDEMPRTPKGTIEKKELRKRLNPE